MADRIFIPELRGWPLGQQSSVPIMAMSPGSLLLCRNAEIMADGGIRNRRAAKTISDMVATASGAPILVGGLTEYQTSSVREIIIAGDVAWHKWNAATSPMTISAITDGTGNHTANARWSLVRWRDETRDWIIGANGTDAVRYYNGSTTQTLGLSYTLKYLAVWNDHLWGAAANSNILRYSELRNPTSFLSTRYDVMLDTSGGSITGIGTTPESLLYMSRRQTNILKGGAWTNFNTVARYKHIGCVDHRSIQETPWGTIWLDDDGLYLFNEQGRPQCISTGNSDIFRSLDFDQLTYCASAYYRNPLTKMHKYICALTLDGQARNTYCLEYTLETGGWTVRTGEQIYEAVTGHDANDLDVLYSMGADAMLQRHDQESGDVVPVDFMMLSAAIVGGGPHIERTAQRIKIFYQADTAAELEYRVTVNVHGRMYPSTGTNTLTLTPDTTIPDQYNLDMIPNKKHFLESASIRMVEILPGDVRGFTHQLQLHNRQVGRTFSIRGIVWEFQQEDVE